MSLSVKGLSISLGIVSGLASIVCGVFFAVAPKTAEFIGSSLMHGVAISAKPLNPINYGVGIITAIALGAIAGALIAVIYNKFEK